MIAYQPQDARQLISDAIEKNGASRVLYAAILALLRERPKRQPRPPDPGGLNAHLLRDIGLHREPEAVDWRHLI